MKNPIFVFCTSLFAIFFLNAQTTTFDNLNANPLTNKAITWTSSNYGSGFGHRIINSDLGSRSLLSIQGRHNSSSWTDIMKISSDGYIGLGTDVINGGKLSIKTSWGHWMSFISSYNSDAYHFHNPNNGGRLELFITDGLTNQSKFGVFTVLRNGNVGIGTTSPGEKLHVNGLIRIPSATSEDNNSPGIVLASNDDFLYDGQYINQYGFGFHGYQDGTTTHNNPNNTYMSGHFGLDFFTGSQNRMRISRLGEVTIGTPNRQPGYKLAVNGNIKAKEIKVETGWSDFVFESNYNLPTLKEVEQHIKEKGHLKDIPSAKDVEENGILLGGMNAKLLQKIEELTLYTIEQEKQLEKQETLIKQQDEVNQELKDRLLRLEQLLSTQQQTTNN